MKLYWAILDKTTGHYLKWEDKRHLLFEYYKQALSYWERKLDSAPNYEIVKFKK